MQNVVPNADPKLTARERFSSSKDLKDRSVLIPTLEIHIGM